MTPVLNEILLTISLLGIFLSLVLFFFIRNSGNSNIFLAIFFLANASYGLGTYAVVCSHSPTFIALLYGTVSPVYFLMGPAGFLYVRSLLRDDARLSKTDYLHFVPFVVQLINSIPYIFSSFEYKLQTTALLIKDIERILEVRTGWFITPHVNYILRPAHILVYVVLQSVILFRYCSNKKKRDVPVRQNKIVMRWLVLFCGCGLILYGSLMFATLLAYTLPDKYLLIEKGSAFPVVLGIPFVLLNTIILLFPQILYGLPRLSRGEFSFLLSKPPPKTNHTAVAESSVQPVEKSGVIKKAFTIDEEVLEDFHTVVSVYMSNGPYLDKDFSLAQMSVDVKIPTHHLSYYFNHYLEEKFTDWRNRHRVGHALNLIHSGKNAELSLEGIGLQSGFSSRSTFFTVFKKETGSSPSHYVGNMLTNK